VTNSASTMASPSPQVITTWVAGSTVTPERASSWSATARRRSALPVNGSQLLASACPTASLVARSASCGGRRSVSRFSSRSTSGSLPTAAATRSIPKPGMPAIRWDPICSPFLLTTAPNPNDVDPGTAPGCADAP
jgi:hypothetical protein